MTRLEAAAEAYREAMRAYLDVEADRVKLREQRKHLDREESALGDRERRLGCDVITTRGLLCEAAAPEEHARAPKW